MPDQSVTIQGLDELRAKFANFPTVAPQYINQALTDSGSILVTLSQQATLATLPQKTGNLRSAFKWETSGQSGTFYVDDQIAPYAYFVYAGTKPHIIRAVNASALAFPWNKTGYVAAAGSGRRYYSSKHAHQSSSGVSFVKGKAGVHGGAENVFFKQVNHPGTRAYPYMDMIAQQGTPQIVAAFSKQYAAMINAS